jgi:predicted nucleotidyltransferase
MTRPYTVDQIRTTLRAVLPELRRRYPIASVAIFGSWARGEAGPNSDLDLLVTFDGPIGWEIVTLEDELAASLGLPVEIVLEQSLRPYIRVAIVHEIQNVWSRRPYLSRHAPVTSFCRQQGA